MFDILKLLLLSSSLLFSTALLAANYHPQQLEQLRQETKTKGVTSVVVTLPSVLSLSNLKKGAINKRGTLQQEAQQLRLALGEQAWNAGYHENGLGQVALYVTEKGLDILAKTDLALKFSLDTNRKGRFKVYSQDGSLDAIEAQLDQKGSASVEVFLNIDTFEYRLGQTRQEDQYHFLPGYEQQVEKTLQYLIAEPFARGASRLNSQQAMGKIKPSVMVTLNREAFYGLRESERVRAIRPVGYQDPRKAQWPQEVLDEALALMNTEYAAVEVLISLRGGEFFSPSSGYMSQLAWARQSQANQLALQEILANVSISVDQFRFYADHGYMSGRLSFEQLVKLYKNADKRIFSVMLNKPIGSTSLIQSTQLINMPSAWSFGYTAPGQNIIILDSGIRKDHQFLQNASGSKVTFEACFGTTNATHTTNCPSPNIYGDSLLGLPGSGEPCSASGCYHGTHVAGIAAGRANINYWSSSFQGVAPDANLISAQVFSTSNSGSEITSFLDDLADAMNTVKNAVPPGTIDLYNTVNISLGMPMTPFKSQAICDNTYFPITNRIADLNSLSIPVVIATGNDHYKDAISWPACVSHAVKVSSVDAATGLIVSDFANIINPSTFAGPFFLAPGEVIRSSVSISSTATMAIQGTSMAAPHVSGLYAAIKAAIPGVTVANATDWINTQGSVSVTAHGYTFRRIHLPNF